LLETSLEKLRKSRHAGLQLCERAYDMVAMAQKQITPLAKSGVARQAM